MIRKATNYVPFDDDRALLEGCGVTRPAVSVGGKFLFDPQLFTFTDPIGCAEGGNWFAYVGDDPCNAIDPNRLDEAETVAAD